MPRVPTYDSFTVAPATNPNVQVTAPEFQDFSTKQGAALAQGAMQSGSAISRIAADMQHQANLVRVDDATNKAAEAALALQFAKPDADGNNGGFTTVMGESALNRPDGKPLAVEYQEKFQQRVDQISQTLGNDAQRQLFAMKARDLSTKLYANATAHETEQFKTYSLSVQDGKMKNASDAIILDPLNTDAVAKNLADISQAVYTVGKLKGMSAQAIEAAQRDAVSGTHLSVVKSLLMPNENGDANSDAAAAYFKQFKDQMGGVQRAEAAKLVGAADLSKVAISTASEIWGQIGPTNYNDPVDLYNMEAKAREMFPSEPAKSKAVIEELRSRKAAFDASQSEFVADNVNQVGKMLLAGKSMAAIKASPAFQALPGDKQEQIEIHGLQRSNTIASLADAQRAKSSFAQYLDYTNPDKLVAMSRKEVEALWPTLGREQTATLVSRWDALQNKDARLTASMDQAQFNAIAESFELHPYETSKSEADKAKLGLLHHQVNLALDAEAKAKRQPLSPEEKEKIMRREMAKTITVNPGWYWFSESKPAIMVADDEVKNIVVPSAERATLASEMARLYAVNKNEAYAASDLNLKRYYLLKKRAERQP